MTTSPRYGDHTPETALEWMRTYASSNGIEKPERSEYYNAEALAWCFGDAHGLLVDDEPDEVVTELAGLVVREWRNAQAAADAEHEATVAYFEAHPLPSMRRTPRTGAALLARVRASGGLDAFDLLGHASEAESLVRGGYARWKGPRNARRLVAVGVAA